MKNKNARVIMSGTTNTGLRVTWALEQGSYEGAAPYHAVIAITAKRAQLAARYTPNEDRARALYHAMMRGITDPEGLRDAT
jgi:hypothetical protein